MRAVLLFCADGGTGRASVARALPPARRSNARARRVVEAKKLGAGTKGRKPATNSCVQRDKRYTRQFKALVVMKR